MSAHLLPMTRRQSRLHGIALIVGLLVICAGVGTYFYHAQPIRLDDATLCPTGRGLESSTVILVDTTDTLTLTRTHARRALAAVRKIQQEIPIHGKLTLLLLEASSPYEPRELVSLCNPGSARTANSLTETPRRIEARWQKSFNGPIMEALDRLMRAPTAPQSPILETLSSITLRPDFDGRVPARRLLVISDLLQHTPKGFSHYTTVGGLWSGYLQSPLVDVTMADLRGAVIELEYLRRPTYRLHQTRRHRQFWRQWFRQAGAQSVTYFGIPNQQQLKTINVRAAAAK